MACPLIAFALLVWANAATVRVLRAGRASTGWWITITILWLAGVGAGVWGGFFFEYQASPTLRVSGAPLPVGVASWEGPPGQEQWVGYVAHPALLSAAVNVPLTGLLAGCLIGPAFLVVRRRRGRP